MKIKRPLEFTERMFGHWSENSADILLPVEKIQFLNSELSSERKEIEFTVTVKIDDFDSFINDPLLTAKISGTISTKNHVYNISSGQFNLFTRAEESANVNAAKEMHYSIYFEDDRGQKMTLHGFKEIIHNDGLDLWKETTTLYFYIWKGHSAFNPKEPKAILGLGILHISVHDFLNQLTTFKTDEAHSDEKLLLMGQFFSVFAGQLWKAYAPFALSKPSDRLNEHYFPVHTTIGVPAKSKTIHSIDTEDGLSLLVQRFKERDCKNVVLLIHGLTSSTDMFIMPEHYNLVSYLLAHGYDDVWSLDWRGSLRYPYNLIPSRDTIDEVAKYDIPKVVEYIRANTAPDTKIHIISHCVGSIAVSCALAAGHITGIQSLISNSVSLTPKVRWQALAKLILGPPILEYIFGYPYISPKIPYFPGISFGKWLYYILEKPFRHECSEPSCHMVSFMWGFGYPAYCVHDNLHPTTHRRLLDLFGGVGFHYYRHVRKMILEGGAVPYKKKGVFANLPDSYLQNIRSQKLPPTLLVSGRENLIFPQSNKASFEELKKIDSSLSVDYVEIPNYGHQDIFIGKNAHVDVFPKFIEFLNRHKF